MVEGSANVGNVRWSQQTCFVTKATICGQDWSCLTQRSERGGIEEIPCVVEHQFRYYLTKGVCRLGCKFY